MREDIGRFEALGATVVAIAPHKIDKVGKFVSADPYPFPLLADPDTAVFRRYDVLSKIVSLGQRPAVFVVDGAGIVRFDAVGTKMQDIAGNDEVLAVLAGL